jgi:hypothetical protein
MRILGEGVHAYGITKGRIMVSATVTNFKWERGRTQVGVHVHEAGGDVAPFSFDHKGSALPAETMADLVDDAILDNYVHFRLRDNLLFFVVGAAAGVNRKGTEGRGQLEYERVPGGGSERPHGPVGDERTLPHCLRRRAQLLPYDQLTIYKN